MIDSKTLLHILPDWIVYDSKKKEYRVTLDPVTCQRCGYTWYPRVKTDGSIEIPVACASTDCRSKIWWKPK